MGRHNAKSMATINSKIKQICRIGESLWESLGDDFDYTIKTKEGDADLRDKIFKIALGLAVKDESVFKRQIAMTSESILSAGEETKRFNQGLYNNIRLATSNDFSFIRMFDYIGFEMNDIRVVLSDDSSDFEIRKSFGMSAVSLVVAPKVQTRAINTCYISTYIEMYLLIRNGVLDRLEKLNLPIKNEFKQLNKDMLFEDMMDWVAQYSNGADVVKQYIISTYIKPNDNSSLRKFYKALAADVEANKKEYFISYVELPDEIKLSSTYQKLVKKPGFESLISSVYKSFKTDGIVCTMAFMASMCQAFSLKPEPKFIEASLQSTINGMDYEIEMLMSFIKVQSDAIDYADGEIDRYKKESTDRRAQYKKQRSINKELSKSIDELTKRLDKRNNDVKRQQEIIEELRGKGYTSTKPYEEELDKLRSEIKRTKDAVSSLERANGRLKKDKAEMSNKVNNLENQLKESREKLENTRRVSRDNTSQAIPIEAYVNALKDTRILVVGGDISHQYMQSLGFNNIKFIKTDNHCTPDSDIANSDIIVILTSHVSHVTSIKPKNVAIKYNIPIVYYNNTNINGLIIEIFKTYFMAGTDTK